MRAPGTSGIAIDPDARRTVAWTSALVLLSFLEGCTCAMSHTLPPDASVDAPIVDPLPDAGPSRDADIPPDATIGDVLLDVRNATFTFCNCHHGCGPGLDGTLELHATNRSSALATLELLRVQAEPIGGPAPIDAFPMPSPTPNYFTVAGPGGYTRTLPMGETVLALTVYADVAELRPGGYQISVDVRLDGVDQTIYGGAITVTATTGCP